MSGFDVLNKQNLKRSFGVLLLLLCTTRAWGQSVPPPGDPQPQVLVGTLSGEVSVNNLGALDYSIPLKVSPGTARVEPKLSVAYSSRSGNGLLGVGFSINGLSVITRGGASLDQDGFNDGVDFDDNDRFLLDGQRLEIVAANGTATTNRAFYGDTNTQYRTEIDSFSRVEAFGQAGNGPAWFKVWTKSGLIYEYGHSVDSSFEPGTNSTVLSWAVNRISDTAGNYMDFVYATDSAGPIIEQINYTGNTNSALALYNSVEFEYEERPDALLRFFRGAQMEQTNRLSKIIMKHNGDYLHDYRLSYTNSAAGQSLLVSIQQFFGVGTEVDRLPETRFEYSGVSAGTNFNYVVGNAVFPAGLKCFIQRGDRFLQGDFNGDGLTDICSVGHLADSRWTGLSKGDGTFSFTNGFSVFPASLRIYTENTNETGSVLQTGDFNGDGLTDLVSLGAEPDACWTGLSNGDGTFSFTNGVAVLSNDLKTCTFPGGPMVVTGDFNGDGLTDIFSAGQNAEYNWLGLSNGDGTFRFPAGTGVLTNSLKTFSGEGGCALLAGDFNGDGLTDVCSVGHYNSPDSRWLGLSNGDGTLRFPAGNNFLPSNVSAFTGSNGCAIQLGDFNGDGLMDLCSVGQWENNRWMGLSNGDGTLSFTTGTNFLAAQLEASTDAGGPAVLTGDFNGDGLTDICCVGQTDAKRWMGLSRGDGTLDTTSGEALLPDDLNAYMGMGGCVVRAGDFNGDGRTDLCSMGYNNYQARECRWVGLSNGNGTLDYDSGDALRRACTDLLYYSTGDFNGDGLPDLIGVTIDNNYYSNDCWVGINTYQAVRLEKVTEGFQTQTQYGAVTQIEYLPLSNTNIYIKGSGATWPVRDEVPAMHAVATLKKDDGLGGVYITDYTYRSARRHLRGRGFLGFQQFESYDRQKQLSTIETLAHEFPFTGRVLKRETYYIPDPSANPSSLGYAECLNLSTNIWQFDLVAGGTLFAFNPKTIETTWELGNTNDVVTQTTIWNWYDNQTTTTLPPTAQPTNLLSEITYGNLVKSVVDRGNDLVQISANSYTNWVDSSHWMLDRLATSSVTHKATGQNDIVRTTSFDYDPSTGLLAQETLEPNDPVLELITDYYYDALGNVTNKTLSPTNFTARTVLAVKYDTRGRFVEESWNALLHKTTFFNQASTGKVLIQTDPNQLPTHWQYDPLGRKTLEQRPDGTSTKSTYSWDNSTTVSVPTAPGSSSNIVQTSAYKLLVETSGAPPVTAWFDKLGREIRTQTQSADGRLVNKDTGYNVLGQTVAVSNPYFSGTPVYAFSQYDARGRPKLQTAADGTKTAYGYDGLSLSVTNNFGATDGTPESRNQVVSTLKNAKGETVSVTTYLNTTPLTVSYLHDPVGNLIQTTDPNNNIIQMHYDIRGNKTWQSDPDMGVWSYHYNALDELVDQTNANLQVTSMEYDLLGRMVKRIAPEGTAQWVFDNSGEGGKLGALWREELTDGTNLVQRKTYAYDAFKRLMLELMNHDGKWFYTTFRYDDRSRLHYTDWFWRSQAVIDSGNNLSPDWNRFSMEYIYDDASGFLIAVKDGTGHQWWSCALSDYDEQGRFVGFEQGNGVETAIHFNPQTGHIEEINFSNLGAGSADYEFEYDRLGGLTQRTLSRTSQSMLSETCTYDSLNRLQTTTVGGVTASTTYDVLGNIKTKTGITGIYVYGSSRPHAVTAANGVSYGYDNGGNMISRTEGTNTSTIAWTSFNKPTRIERGANASEFTYDANHQRITQLTDSAGTLQKKIYIGNRMEQEEAPNGQGGWTNTLTRIFVSTPAGVIGIEERTPAQTTRQYLHRDPLGSIVAVSGEAQSGNAPLLAEYAYDAWGKRRNSSNWSPTTTNPANPTTDRGFTGHEMLDHIDLIHMNGRIYDPLIGRFLSPDPQIQAPENLQSFNRYTYVLNRPLSLTDPSGFTAEGNFFQSSNNGYWQLYAPPITSVVLSSYDNIGGVFIEITVWTTDWWTDEDNELQFTMILESITIEHFPAVVESVGGGNGGQGYVSKSLEQIWKGNYSDNTTLLGTAGQIGTGLLGVDLPCDIRDLTYDFQHWRWSWGHAGQTALDAVGLFPIIGALKYADEGGDLLKKSTRLWRAPKNADDLLQQSRKYLGDGDLIIEKPLSGSDLIIRTQDRSKQIRFDLSDPHGLDPHVNVEAWKPRNKFPGDRKMLPDPDVVPDGNLHLFPEAK